MVGVSSYEFILLLLGEREGKGAMNRSHGKGETASSKGGRRARRKQGVSNGQAVCVIEGRFPFR